MSDTALVPGENCASGLPGLAFAQGSDLEDLVEEG